MQAVSEANKSIAKMVAKAFGGHPQVTRFWDDNHESFVDILVSDDRPQRGVKSYSTIGLSDSPLYIGGKKCGTRLEIVGACDSAASSFDNAIATAAFCIINSRWPCYPGAVFPDALSMYACSPTMRHFLFLPPFLWETELKTSQFGGKTVSWLLAVPISDAERQFAENRGSDKLEDLFVERQIDVFNIERLSVVQ